MEAELPPEEDIVPAQEPVLLATKLYVPQANGALVARPSLVARIEQGLERRLTLVSAPAGFGKTTLLADWAGQTERPVAWLTLDTADSGPARFLLYLAAALRTVDADLGLETLAALESNQPPQGFGLLAGLLGEVGRGEKPFVLVLDDYHLLEQEAIHAAVRFITENSPPNLHLIISTREDPPWPLARLRAGGEMSEIRGRDLRFTPSETAEFCNDVMGLNLSTADLAALGSRAEGWVAGLQLATLTMQRDGDVGQLVEGFSGSNRYVLDYLLEEVLNQQPAEIQQFLLHTAILERLCAPLCDELLGVDGSDSDSGASSQALLEQLEAANLFIVPLDGSRYWYRYHNLFSDLLRARLLSTEPHLVRDLHRLAARWFAGQGFIEEAISHALQAEDFDLAAELLEAEGLDLVSRHKMISLAHWLEALPASLVQQRPWLSIFMAFTRHWLGEREFALGAALDQAQQALENNPPASAEEAKRIRGAIASLRAQDALSAGDLPQIIEQANLALELLPPDDMMGTEAGVSLGGAYWIQGDALAAERAFAAGRDTSRRAGKFLMAVPSATYAGWMQMKQGRLQEALASFEEALTWATRENVYTVPIGGFPMLRISDLRYEWQDYAAAETSARQGRDLCLRLNQADVVVDAHATFAQRLAAAGEADEAWRIIKMGDDAARNSRPDPFLLTKLDAARIYLWLDVGQVENAQAWLVSHGPDLNGPLSYHHDLHHLLAARVLLAIDRPQEALTVAQRVVEAAARAGWVSVQIRALALAAAARQRLGDTSGALSHLEAALELGAHGRFVRSILDQGQAVHHLLWRIAASDSIPEDYLERLRACSDVPEPSARSPIPQPLIEPLSERELEILNLIALGLTNQQIAQRLVLSLATIKWHASNIYGKLGVRNRNQAVAAARDLGLLS